MRSGLALRRFGAVFICASGVVGAASLVLAQPLQPSEAAPADAGDAGLASDAADPQGDAEIDAAPSVVAVTAPARAPELPPPAPSPSPPLAPSFDQPAFAHADDVSLDAHTQELDLRGNVQLDVPPFFLRSDDLRVRRSRLGLDMEGDGRLIFCPCLGAPLAVAFSGGTVAPPADVILKSPRLLVFGVPVLWLPYFWLRSAGRPGLLAPEIAIRGTDGLFLGGGVHLPWKKDDLVNGLDLRAGGYVKGGAAVDVRLVTPVGTTRVVWDHLDSDGLTVDMRGAVISASGGATVGWDVDAVRGARGLRATTDLEAAARPVDRARVSVAYRLFDGDGSDWTLVSRVHGASPRGGSLDALGLGGPDVALRGAGALTNGVVYDATAIGGAWTGTFVPTTSFVRGDAGLFAATRIAPFGVEMRVRAAGDAANDGTRSASDGSAMARAAIGLPLSRRFSASSDGPGSEGDAVIHRTEPRLAVSALTTGGDALLGAYTGRGYAGAVRGSSWVASGEWANAIGPGYGGGRRGAEFVVAGGAVGNSDGPRAVVRARGTADFRLASAAVDVAALPAMSDQRAGDAVSIFTRIGSLDAFHVGGRIDGRDGIDPVAARALFDAPLEPGSGFIANTGWTARGNASIPWTRNIATTGGADFDLGAQQMIGARGAVELRDACGCLIVRAIGAHRIGRPGIDAGVTIDFAPH